MPLIRRVSGRRATSGTPAQFGFALRSWLQHHAFHHLTAQSHLAGWTEGGCGYLAHALKEWAGTGEIMVLWGGEEPIVHHLVWQHDDLYFDGDGAARKQTLIHRMLNEWDVRADLAPYGDRAKRSMAKSNIRCFPEAVPTLVEALKARFGAPQDWGFGRPRGSRVSGRRDLLTEAIKEFGTTENPWVAGFILPDGRLLDLGQGQSQRVVDHRAVARWIGHDGTSYGSRTEAMNAWMRATGALRLSYHQDGFVVDAESPLTPAQRQTISSLMRSRPEWVALSCPGEHGKTMLQGYPRAHQVLAVLECGTLEVA